MRAQRHQQSKNLRVSVNDFFADKIQQYSFWKDFDDKCENARKKSSQLEFSEVCWFVEFWKSLQTIEPDFLR